MIKTISTSGAGGRRARACTSTAIIVVVGNSNSDTRRYSRGHAYCNQTSRACCYTSASSTGSAGTCGDGRCSASSSGTAGHFINSKRI
ncbi:hypothetical protein [Brenneria rubrifaciens]|uniref:hypothetical protein n=1 Tax=Brenneria rubrifaciens TaxID=55213 RepID=UPI001586D197|nr:hypothetical protein [Brenneria rubrifaciens]